MPTLAALLLLLAPLPQRVAMPADDASAPFRVVGRATLRGRPFEDAALAVELRAGDEVLSAVDVVTADDGTFSVPLRRPDADRFADDPWLRRKLTARVRAIEPGFMRTVWEERVPTDGAVVRLRDLALHEGGTLTLRVIDADGVPVPSAELEVERFAERPVEPPPTTGSRTKTISCCGGPPRPGIQPAVSSPHAHALDVHLDVSAHTNLLVRSPGRGTAWVADVTCPFVPEERSRTVQLRGAGALSGELRDPDGDPREGVALTLYPADLAGERDPSFRLRSVRAARETAGGLVTGEVLTDADGRFAFTGLLPGEYLVLPAGGDETVGTIPRRTFATGTFASLVMPWRWTASGRSRPSLLSIRVVAPPHTPTVGRTGTRRLTRTPAAFGIGQCMVGLERKPLDAGAERTCGWSVLPGDRYAFAWVGDHHVVEREVVIDPDRPRTPVELVLDEPLPRARLTVELRDPSGAALRLDPHERTSVELGSQRSGLPFFTKGCDDAQVAVIDLPPHAYAITMSASLAAGAPRGAQRPLLWHGADPLPVELAPGERRHVVLPTWEGGRVRLALDLPDGEKVAAESPRAVVTVVGADDRELSFSTDSSSPRLGAVLGTASVSHAVLRPGPRLLRIEAPGYEPETVRVDVLPREVVDARVVLRRLP